MKNKIVSCTDVEGKNHKVKISDLDWRISVYGVIIEKDKILLLRQKLGFDFPGGGMKKGETITQALTRECKEETNLKVKVSDLLHADSTYYFLKRNQTFVQNILLYYRCKRISGLLSNKNFDENEKQYAIGPEWVSLKEIKKITFQNGTDSLALIKKALTK